MKIYLRIKDLIEIRKDIGATKDSTDTFLTKLSRRSGDTYIVKGTWDDIQWSPGDKARIVKKK